MKLDLLNSCSKYTQMTNFMKSSPVRDKLLHEEEETEGLMDRHDASNSRFSQYCERAQKFFILPTDRTCVFHTHLRTNSDYITTQP